MSPIGYAGVAYILNTITRSPSSHRPSRTNGSPSPKSTTWASAASPAPSRPDAFLPRKHSNPTHLKSMPVVAGKRWSRLAAGTVRRRTPRHAAQFQTPHRHRQSPQVRAQDASRRPLMAMLFSWAMSGLGQCAPAIPPKVRALAVEPVQNVLFREPHQLPDLYVRQARFPQPLHMPLRAAEKSCQFLGGHQRPFFRGFLSCVVACRHTMHLGVNSRPVQSLPVAVREWKSTFSTPSKPSVSWP